MIGRESMPVSKPRQRTIYKNRSRVQATRKAHRKLIYLFCSITRPVSIQVESVYPSRHGPTGQNSNSPDRARRVPLQERRRRRHLRRQGQEPAQPRVRYFHEGRWEDAKTGTLVREAVDVEYIVVANNKEALALENHLIKQRKPRFNILLRDDKTYPYVKLTLGERYPRVYVTRRLRKDGSAYYGPYFPANLAYRIVDLIHRNFLVPSCKVDLTRYHPRPCLQYYIRRCLGPCVRT